MLCHQRFLEAFFLAGGGCGCGKLYRAGVADEAGDERVECEEGEGVRCEEVDCEECLVVEG